MRERAGRAGMLVSRTELGSPDSRSLLSPFLTANVLLMCCECVAAVSNKGSDRDSDGGLRDTVIILSDTVIILSDTVIILPGSRTRDTHSTKH